MAKLRVFALYELVDLLRQYTLSAKLVLNAADIWDILEGPFLAVICPWRIQFERLLCADTVEKLQIFPDGKFIYAVAIYKFAYTGREPKLTISSDRAIGELTY